MPVFLAITLAGAVMGLPLPDGYTVAPEGKRRLISINARGTVLASASIPNGYAKDRVVRWRRGGTRAVFVPLPAPSWYPSPELEFAEASALAGDDVAYVDVARPFSGAYSGVSYETQRWAAGAAQRFAPVRCGGASGFPHAAAVDARGRVAMTYDTSAGLILDPEHPASDAPIANLATESSCTALGRGVVLAVRGAYAAGYRGYLGTSLAPIPLNPQQQTMRVVRWRGSAARELGQGVGLAVNASGVVAGASALPALSGEIRFVMSGPNGTVSRAYAARVPSALMWDASGRVTRLAPASRRSVAYDVGDDGTVVGMLVDRAGKHRAFRWARGRLTLLDDLPHPPGWRFESAYALAADGAIVGIGTYRGIATVFVYRHAGGSGEARTRPVRQRRTH